MRFLLVGLALSLAAGCGPSHRPFFLGGSPNPSPGGGGNTVQAATPVEPQH
jgi:hypothetical protein